MYCTACGTRFENFLDLSRSQEISTKFASFGVGTDKLRKIRLFWKIVPNKLEERYIEWLCSKPKGQFLITWPWNEVRFLPLIASEYAINEKEKIAIIGRIQEEEKDLFVPTMNTTFGKLVYLNNKKPSKYQNFKKDLFGCIDEDIIKMTENVHIHIRGIGTKITNDYLCDTQSIIRCKRKIINEINEMYGEDCIREITTKRAGRSRVTQEVLNENGYFDVTLDRRLERSGKLEYTKSWELEILSAFNENEKIHIPSQQVKYKVIKSPHDIEDDSVNNIVYFISEELHSEILYPYLKRLGVKVLIFENIDCFIKDIIYGGYQRYWPLVDFLKERKEAIFTFLMFSTEPEIRHLHNKFANDVGSLTIQTLDTAKRLELLFNNEWSESKYPNPYSSMKSQISHTEIKYEIIYEVVNEIDEIFDEIDQLLKELKWEDYNLKKGTMKYFKDMRKTPLDYIGDYSRYEVFKRKKIGIEFTFESVMLFINGIDEDICNKLTCIHDNFFGKCRGKRNVLFKKIDELARELINYSIITIVVHPYDCKGFEHLLIKEGFEEYLKNNLIAVTSWSTEVGHRCVQATSMDKKHIVISTEAPSINFNLYNCEIDKVIFIGSKKNLDKIKEIIEKRITESFRRPVTFLSENDDAPAILKKIEKESHTFETLEDDSIDSPLPKNDDAPAIFKQIEKESHTFETLEDDSIDSTVIEIKDVLFPFQTCEKTSQSISGTSTSRYLKSGERILIAIASNGTGILFPMNTTLHYRVSEGIPKIEEIETSDKRLNSLKNVEIYLGKKEDYRSFKTKFVELMLDKGADISIEAGVFKWSNFPKLLYDSVSWTKYLQKAKKTLILERHIKSKDADDELACRIVNSGTSARDLDYVKIWWKGYEGVVDTSIGKLRIPFVEHPRNADDLRKIYKVINEIISDPGLDDLSALKSYNASMIIQKIRRNVLGGTPENLPKKLRNSYQILRPYIDEIWSFSDTFYVQYFERLILAEDMPAYKIINLSDVSLIK
ncbi:hypothetical protein MSSAC_2702 [Methanosarcina siciliae C2J]|uniref:Uncharacterized protein n=1 Tax=Methanosarcina siciliae C2J TaxID=1434118 RepID=A0A0E3PQH8_9EURY|nr:hypothetical protein MSSAC_2702 [Methanosarcina siciliae C2J]